jgi:glutathione S-transferase
MKLPVFEDQGRCIFETSAICSYLCDRVGANKLVPRPGTLERAKHDQWLSVIQCELEPALWMKAKHKFVLPEDLRVKDPRLKESLAYEVKVTLGPITDELKNSEWLTGPNFTLADVFLAYCLDWSRHYGFWSDPLLAGYLQSAQSREAFARAVSRTQAESSLTGA